MNKKWIKNEQKYLPGPLTPLKRSAVVFCCILYVSWTTTKQGAQKNLRIYQCGFSSTYFSSSFFPTDSFILCHTHFYVLKIIHKYIYIIKNNNYIYNIRLYYIIIYYNKNKILRVKFYLMKIAKFQAYTCTCGFHRKISLRWRAFLSYARRRHMRELSTTFQSTAREVRARACTVRTYAQ